MIFLLLRSCRVEQIKYKLSSPPAYVTDAHLKKLEKVRTTLDKLMIEIKIEWLVEKFREPSDKDRMKFICLLSSLLVVY